MATERRVSVTPSLPAAWAALAASGPLSALPNDALAALVGRGRVLELGRGEHVPAEDRAEVHVVLSGTLGAYLDGQGPPQIVEQLGPGGLAGTSGWPAGLRLTAESPCRLGVLEATSLARAAAEHPAFARELERHGRDRASVRALLQRPLFSKLPPNARRSLLRFARIEHAPAGTAFVRQGEYTGDFYVIQSGIVTAYRVEADGTRSQLVQLGPADWFGETSALSQQPSPAKLQADTPCVYAVLAPGLFKELYVAGAAFRKAIDDGYRERGLAIHLSIVPTLRELPRDAIRAIQRLARFVSVKKDAVVAREGEPATSVYLVRSGALVTQVADGPRQRLTGYLMTNSSFGEHALSGEGGPWPATYTAMTDSDLLELPAAELRAALAGVPGALERVAANVRAQVAEDADAEELAVMAQGQSAKGGEALVIDLEKCVRCNVCVESCVAVHDDHVPRLSKRGQRVSAAANTMQKEISLVTSCYSCGTPGCMLACGYGAIRRNSRGLIRFIYDNCVGCAQCVEGCPYDVIRLTPPPDPNAAAGPRWIASLPGVGGWLSGLFGPRASGASSGSTYHKEVEVHGKAVKCDRCEGLPFEACVYNCPTGAIERRAPAALFGRSTGPEAGR